MKKLFCCLLFLLGTLFCGSASAQTVEFTVKKGDNFWKLAKEYGVKHSEIIKLNRDKLKYRHNPNLIFPGQSFLVEIPETNELSKSKASGDLKSSVTYQNFGSASIPKPESFLKTLKEEKNIDLKDSKIVLLVGLFLTGTFFVAEMRRREKLSQELKLDSAIGPSRFLSLGTSRNLLATNEAKKDISLDPVQSIQEFLDEKGLVKPIEIEEVFAIGSVPPIQNLLNKKDFIGIDAEGACCIISEVGEFKGGLFEVATFVADQYAEDYALSIAYVRGSMEPPFYLKELEAQEKRAFEDYLDCISQKKDFS